MYTNGYDDRLALYFPPLPHCMALNNVALPLMTMASSLLHYI